MSDSSQGSCRRCKAQVYWFKSFKTGKSYCCDTDDRRDFHKCDESTTSRSNDRNVPKPTPKPIQPDYFENVSIEHRMADLESAMAQIAKRMLEIEKRHPITAEDVGF